MRIIALVTLLLYPISSSGNPIVVFENGTFYDATKSSENCIVIVGKEASTVSCEVDYRLKKAKTKEDSYYLHLALPIYVAPKLYLNNQELLELLKPRVEFDGEVFLMRPGKSGHEILAK